MKLYLETTVPNFLFAADAPEKQNATAARLMAKHRTNKRKTASR
jgi:hypothetical protein